MDYEREPRLSSPGKGRAPAAGPESRGLGPGRGGQAPGAGRHRHGNQHVKNILASLPRAIHHDAVFTYQNEPIGTLGGVKKSFITACEKAGILQGQDEPEGIIFHDIRRTVKTNMLSAGVDKVYRDTILGHSLVGMDVHYMAPSEEDLHRAMALYTKWLNGQIANISHSVNNCIKKGQPT